MTIEKISNNPGILPIKLGSMQNVVDYWTLIQKFDLTTLKNEFYILKDSYIRINKSMQLSKFGKQYSYEMSNYKNIIENMISVTEIKFDQVTSVDTTKRQKRGLVNGLGNIIKAVTGNLDSEDAERYDKAIEQLINNQKEIKTIVKDQISLAQSAIIKFNETIAKISTNQKVLQSRIMQIEQAMNEVTLANTNMYALIIFNTIFTQLITAITSVQQILNTLENAVSFAKLNALHPSIINPVDLLAELKVIDPLISHDRLPFDVNENNVLLFEKIANVKGYIKGNEIIFIIEIPIVESHMYNYFHLFAFPMKVRNHYQVIIPKNKFLSLNELKYGLSNEICNEIAPSQFICHSVTTTMIHEDSPCEVQLLRFSNNYKMCIPKIIQISRTKLQKVAENKWIAVFPKEVIATQVCNKEENNEALAGSYSITITESCYLKLDKETIRIFQNPSTTRRLANLPNLVLDFDNYKSEQSKNILEPVHLEHLELDDLHRVVQSMNKNRERIDHIGTPTLHYDNLSVWTLLLFLVIIPMITFLAYKKCKKYRTQIPKKTLDKNPLESITLKKLDVKNP